MKRSVAILGPTPQFVRWAISLPCPLRELEGDSLPDQTFRQLRGLREYSLGMIESRVFENVCVHPSADAADIQQCRGFNEDEVLAPQGGRESIDDCCKACPANALESSRPGVWAGCYGWLPAKSGFSFDSATKKETSPKTDETIIDFVGLLEETILKLGLADKFDSLFNNTKPRWYGIWQQAVFGFEPAQQKPNPQLEVLLQLFQKMALDCRAAQADSSLDNLIQIRDAIAACSAQRLALHVELIPPGHSDGQTWTISAHCPECKISLPKVATQQRCSSCGRFGNPHGEQKGKVLGLRPYVRLAGVMGEQKATEFMQRYESRTGPLPGSGNRI